MNLGGVGVHVEPDDPSDMVRPGHAGQPSCTDHNTNATLSLALNLKLSVSYLY